jgi:hypothetical protein
VHRSTLRLGAHCMFPIRHELITKINNKKKQQIYEVLARISVDHSRVRCAFGTVRRAHTCVFHFLIFFKLLEVHIDQPTI